ncbi:RNA-directed DNA polymerase (reverse transcriptase)-related family protein [Thalictrum thalictroides]|uniref:RNA-directed DNA polymerase (Reverse transcriptase)-related family protein n=1 Tax=Thalictrum thalictroides TaxID=46969 RepID=A0A7J6VXQ9_THATH|nr:RNA-directed DNA polymerase (reverse transcriptase)-related family protein [Thalictrum thalictroides]
MEKVSARIQSWKSKLLSYAGRLQLLKSVLNSMSVFWISSFLLPQRAINEINKLCRNFLWGGSDCTQSHASISWRDLCYPYEEGGLKLRDFSTLNHAANMRHVWHLISGSNTLWAQWVRKHLIRDKNFWEMRTPPDCSWSWRNILKERKEAMYMVQHLIGNGRNTSFWKDPWHPNGILLESFPQVLSYDSTLALNAPVATVLNEGRWQVPQHLRIHIAEIEHRLHEVEVGVGEDIVVWTASTSGRYCLKDTYEQLRKTKEGWEAGQL